LNERTNERRIDSTMVESPKESAPDAQGEAGSTLVSARVWDVLSPPPVNSVKVRSGLLADCSHCIVVEEEAYAKCTLHDLC
jgi:hypothetical protein